jgi:hypothetical protein
LSKDSFVWLFEGRRKQSSDRRMVSILFDVNCLILKLCSVTKSIMYVSEFCKISAMTGL